MTSQTKGTLAAILVIVIPIAIFIVAYNKSEKIKNRVDSMGI